MRIITLVVASALLSTPVAARDWPAAGGWDIIEGEDYCALTQEYEGSGATELFLIHRTDGTNVLGAANSEWSSLEDEEYPLAYILNGVSYGGGVTTGTKFGYKNGFSTFMPADFLDHFAAGSSLRIYNGDVLVDQLSLEGTASAVSVLRRCVSHVKAEAVKSAREKARLSHIPTDPFAATRKVSGSAPKGATLLKGSISDADYPSSALRTEAEGTTTIRVVVGPSGRVSECNVTKSSGHSGLDMATCRIVERRFVYQPAVDENGNVTTDTQTVSYTWKLQR